MLMNNISMMRSILLVIFLLIFCVSGIAQQPLLKDSSSVSTRMFSAEAVKAYQADKKFGYDSVLERPKSLWDRFWEWVYTEWEKLLNGLGKLIRINLSGEAFQIVLIFSMLAILTFFILKILGMDKAGLFGKNNTAGMDYSLSEENLQNIHFQQAIQDAVYEKNFRMAVRLLYLQSLKNLTDHKLINWQINKSDEAYIQELNGNQLQQSFKDLTLQFESNWYGGIPINENEFGKVSERFMNFNERLS
jgi:hypothetical protein